jgi:ABC-2 type transport system permease protein
MSTMDVIDESGSAAPARSLPHVSKARAFYWSVRREVWEHPSVWLAPTIVAVLMLAAFAFAASRMADALHEALSREQASFQIASLLQPLVLSAIPIVLTMLLTGMFYCLEALYDERRDRSILFWKSLPVSDTTTVLAKACVPLVVLPIVACIVFISMQFLALTIGTAVLVSHGIDVSALWDVGALAGAWVDLIGWLVTITLWYAPIYGWFLLVSVAANRSPLLWSILLPFVVGLAERIAFDTRYVSDWIRFRLFRGMDLGMGHDMHHTPLPTPFFGDVNLWIGLVIAAVLFAVAIQLRRYRQPI